MEVLQVDLKSRNVAEGQDDISSSRSDCFEKTFTHKLAEMNGQYKYSQKTGFERERETLVASIDISQPYRASNNLFSYC
jgi:hypothetical protein